MEIIYGLALLCAAILLIGFIGKLKRLPTAPKWASSAFVLNPVVFLTVAGIAFGSALAIDGLAGIRSIDFGVLEIALLAVIVGVTVLSTIKIRAMGRSAPRREEWVNATVVKSDQAVPSS
jgi:tellurite resistance protein TehA-like permease